MLLIRFFLEETHLTALRQVAEGTDLAQTATTAASGGNREELLGQRPAQDAGGSEADAGSRNPGSGTEGD